MQIIPKILPHLHYLPEILRHHRLQVFTYFIYFNYEIEVDEVYEYVRKCAILK